MNNNDINNLETQPAMATSVQTSPVLNNEVLGASQVNSLPVMNEGAQVLETPAPTMGIPDPFASQEPVLPVAEGTTITPVEPVVDSLPVASSQEEVTQEIPATTEVLGAPQVAPVQETLATAPVLDTQPVPTLDSAPVLETPIDQTPVAAPETLVTASNIEVPVAQPLESVPVAETPVAPTPVATPEALVTESNVEAPVAQELVSDPVFEPPVSQENVAEQTPVVEAPIPVVETMSVAPVNAKVAPVESLDNPVEIVNPTPVSSDITLLEAQEATPVDTVVPEPVPPVFEQTTRPDGSTSFVPVQEEPAPYQAPVMPEVTENLNDTDTVPVNFTSDGIPYPAPYDTPSDFVKIIGLLQKDVPIPEVAYGRVPTNMDATLNATLEQLYQQKRLPIVQRQYALETPEGVFYPCGPLEATLYNEEEYARVVAPNSANQNAGQATWCKVEARTYDDWYKNSVEVNKVR